MRAASAAMSPAAESERRKEAASRMAKKEFYHPPMVLNHRPMSLKREQSPPSLPSLTQPATDTFRPSQKAGTSTSSRCHLRDVWKREAKNSRGFGPMCSKCGRYLAPLGEFVCATCGKCEMCQPDGPDPSMLPKKPAAARSQNRTSAPESWVCQICTLLNEASAACCAVCRAERVTGPPPGPTAPRSPSAAGPSRDAAAVAAEARIAAAASRGTPRAKKRPASTPTPTRSPRWACPECTLFNSGLASACAACNGSRPETRAGPAAMLSAGCAESPITLE